ncbi:MAG: hypothetical protein JRG82_10250 [Deltaproteobacteria bacterium]|nr:hypothetical protein [Deltaproteobacteria bacterium]
MAGMGERATVRLMALVRHAAFAPVAWGLAALFSGSIVFALEPSVLEEGQLVHVAQRMAAGEHLYRDIVYYTGPLPFELLAFLYRIFGDHVMVGRLAMLPFMGLAAGCSFTLARQAGAGTLAHAVGAVWAAAPVVLFPMLSIFFYTNLAFYLVPVACLAALRGREATSWAITTGVLIAAVALCKQTFGVALAVSLLAAVAATAPAGRRVRALAAIAAGGASAALVCVAVYALRGDLSVFVYSLAVLPFELEGSFFAPYMNFWPIGKLTPELRANAPLYLPTWIYLRTGILVEPTWLAVAFTQLLYASPFLAILASLALAVRRGVSPAVWIHLAGLVTMATNLYPRGDWGHLVFVLPSAATQLLFLLPVRADSPWGVRVLRAVASGVACFALYTLVVVVGTWVNTLARTPTFGPEIPLRPVTPSTRMKSIPRVIHYLRNRVYPGEPIFVARQEPLIYVATGTTNPTPYTGVVMGIRERQQREIVAALEPTRFVVMSDIDQPLYAYYSDELPEVQRYLERHFRVPADFEVDDLSWIQVGARGPDLGVTAIDFIDARADARFWRRGRDGRMRAAAATPIKLPSRQFRRLFAIELGERGGGADFRVDVPPQALFQADTGMAAVISMSELHEHPGGARHALSISFDGRQFETLRTTRVADRSPRSALRWQPFFVDLSPYAGRTVTLRLELIADAPLPEGALAWFGSPRVATPPPGGGAQTP